MDDGERTVRTFHKWAQQYADKYMDLQAYRTEIDRLCELIPHASSRVLDVACGPGNIARHLLARLPHLEIVGIDLAPAMIDIARQAVPNAQFKVHDGRRLKELDGRFDVVVSGFLYPYLSKPHVAENIAQVATKMNPDGIFYLSTMEGDESLSGFESSSQGDQVYIHYHDFGFLERELRCNGFRILETHRKEFRVSEERTNQDLFIYAALSSPSRQESL